MESRNEARLICVAFALMAGLTIVFSPGLRGVARLLAAALFAGWLATVWLRQGLFMLSFYPVGGALAGIAIAGFVVPTWRWNQVPPGLAFLAGVALAAMVATAYSFGPTAVLLGVSGGWCAWRQGDRQAVKWFLIGFVAGGLATLCYLLIFGDLIGYFAFHVAESQADYATYIFFSCRRFFAALVPREEPQDLVQALAVLCTVGALCLFVALDIYQRRPWRQNAGAILLGIVGVVLLNARGDVGFKNGSFVIAAVLLATLALAHLLSLLPPRTACWASLGILALIALTEWRLRPATFTPYDLDGATVAKLGRWRSSGPSDAAPFVRIRQLVRPEERILILVYQPGAYVAADRLPLSGFYTSSPGMRTMLVRPGSIARAIFALRSRTHRHRSLFMMIGMCGGSIRTPICRACSRSCVPATRRRKPGLALARSISAKTD